MVSVCQYVARLSVRIIWHSTDIYGTASAFYCPEVGWGIRQNPNAYPEKLQAVTNKYERTLSDLNRGNNRVLSQLTETVEFQIKSISTLKLGFDTSSMALKSRKREGPVMGCEVGEYKAECRSLSLQ